MELVKVGESFRRRSPYEELGPYIRIEETKDQSGRVNTQHIFTGDRLWIDPSFMVPFKRTEDTTHE